MISLYAIVRDYFTITIRDCFYDYFYDYFTIIFTIMSESSRIIRDYLIYFYNYL
jgi:hypothetical protein